MERHAPSCEATPHAQGCLAVGTRHALSSVPDCPTVRKEFDRMRLVERQPGGGGFRVLEPALAEIVSTTESSTELPQQVVYGEYAFFFIVFNKDGCH